MKDKASKTTRQGIITAAFALPPIALNKNKQSKTLPLTIGFRALLYLNTLHVLVEPVP